MEDKKMGFSNEELMKIIKDDDDENKECILSIAKIFQQEWIKAYNIGYNEGMKKRCS